ncbi:hypothetical protein [Brunnivagina elsteri]|uniref:Uncharacterized protein n=1 Tax=Brunnivagina elsteri CCALA 953 TaxID=987040 RepID=A0A2A2TGZ1_9CYAN|nr:hypothetical protein [Calothrix elsteri]PAX53077.1 hypothetical protein CK510_15895 [Calothrix elsteri CCALA 953]
MKLKTGLPSQLVPTALAMSILLSFANSVGAQQVKISPNFKPDPITLTGKSGGPTKSNCGNISSTPSQVIQVTESLPYLRLTVEGSGQPTLLLDGPGGKFCVLADNYSGGKPEITGFFKAGNYSIHVGELSQAQYNYTLSISQQKK